MRQNGHNAPSRNFREIAVFTWDEARSRAAIALASGKTHIESAADAGVSDRTIRNWLEFTDFAEEVDRLSLMIGIASRAERLRLAMRVVQQKTRGSVVETKADVLDWLKFAQSETDGVKLDLPKIAAAFSTTEAPVADSGSDDQRPEHVC